MSRQIRRKVKIKKLVPLLYPISHSKIRGKGSPSKLKFASLRTSTYAANMIILTWSLAAASMAISVYGLGFWSTMHPLLQVDAKEISQAGVGSSNKAVKMKTEAPLNLKARIQTDDSSYLRELEEEREQVKRDTLRKKIAFAILFIGGLVAYVTWAVDRARTQRAEEAAQALENKIRMFPRSPMEYNLRQRQWFIAESWRRFNIRNISIFCVSLITSVVLMTWHRRRRVFLQKRKTAFFWAWTMAAAVGAFGWSFYILKKQSSGSQMQKILRGEGDPYLRFFTYVGLILLAALSLYIWRLKKGKRKLNRREKLINLVEAKQAQAARENWNF